MGPKPKPARGSNRAGLRIVANGHVNFLDALGRKTNYFSFLLIFLLLFFLFLSSSFSSSSFFLLFLRLSSPPLSLLNLDAGWLAVPFFMTALLLLLLLLLVVSVPSVPYMWPM